MRGPSAPSTSSACSPYYSLIEDGTGTSSDTHNLTGDPLFVDPANGNYHLKTSSKSPCIDAADPDSYPAHDIDGEDRPMGKGPDIGADEAG
jgi:hypothetical protein